MPAMARLNVGVLGLSHDHVWGNLAALRAGDHGRLVAAAEPDSRLRERLRSLDGGVAVHESFDALLERRDLDAVFVFSDNRASAELGARALGRGLPVMLEKPMAADLSGGGALVDYCGYGAVLCRLLLGRPHAVTAVTPPPRKPGLAAEDNAVVVLSYPSALGLLEASWTQIGGEPAFAMIVYGERGTLIVHQPRAPREGERAGAGGVQLVTPDDSRFVEPPPLPADERDGPTHFLACVSSGRAVTDFCSGGVGCDVQEILEAGLRASATGRQVELPPSGG